jgi:glycosyltransferase involved in cell wall biosynthesis
VKIAVLCGHYPYSGAGVIAWESALSLAARHEVTFVHGGARAAERREGDLRVITLEMESEPERSPLHLYWNRRMVRSLREVLDTVDPDVVHYHIVQRRSFSLASLLLSRRRRSVWTLHDQWPLCVRSVPEPPSCEGMKRFCLFCTAWPGLSVLNKIAKESVYAASPLEVVVPSRWLAGLVRFSLLGRKKVHLVYNGLDLERFRPGDGEGERPGNAAVTLLFVAGPNDETKGLRELVEVFVPMRSRHPSLRLRIVGEPPSWFTGVEGVEVKGRVSRDRMPEEYRKGDLFVLPTLADNTPVTLMEAMASGLPSLSTRVGGIPEMVEEGVTGRLVPPGNPAALGRALEGLCGDPPHLRDMGRAARAAAEDRFSMTRMVKELEGIYGAEGGASKRLPVAPAVLRGGGP